MIVSFVLLDWAVAPDGSMIAASYARLFSKAPRAFCSIHQDGEQGVALTVERRGARPAYVVTVPGPVPNGEAEAAVDLGLSALFDDFELPQHRAHFAVTTPTDDDDDPVETLTLHTHLVAAVVDAHRAVGVYEGSARATHGPEFYVEIATTTDIPVMLWTGVSIARPNAKTTEILTLGFDQVGMPNFLFVAPLGSEGDALELLFRVAGHVAENRQAIPEGETIGRTASERLPVLYVPSPVGGEALVARVELR